MISSPGQRAVKRLLLFVATLSVLMYAVCGLMMYIVGLYVAVCGTSDAGIPAAASELSR